MNETKTLKRIHIFARIGKFLSMFLFVLCIIAGIFLLFAVAGLALGANSVSRIIETYVLPTVQKIDPAAITEIAGELPEEALDVIASVKDYITTFDFKTLMIYAALFFVVILCSVITKAILCKLSHSTFRRELENGTPFTFRTADDLRRIGILSLVLPLAVCLVQIILKSSFVAFMQLPIKAVSLITTVTVPLVQALLFILFSLLCRFGAERAASAAASADAPAAEAESCEAPEEAN